MVLGPLLAYKKQLIHLNKSHNLLILNGLPSFLDSNILTCFPWGRGDSFVDYILNHNVISFILNFLVTPIPLLDHPLLNFLSLQSNHSPHWNSSNHHLVQQFGSRGLVFPPPKNPPSPLPFFIY